VPQEISALVVASDPVNVSMIVISAVKSQTYQVGNIEKLLACDCVLSTPINRSSSPVRKCNLWKLDADWLDNSYQPFLLSFLVHEIATEDNTTLNFLLFTNAGPIEILEPDSLRDSVVASN
jgi:hypothetical protein